MNTDWNEAMKDENGEYPCWCDGKVTCHFKVSRLGQLCDDCHALGHGHLPYFWLEA